VQEVRAVLYHLVLVFGSKARSEVKMDDENRNRFMLDTSIIVPVAIAGGVAFAIVVVLYCCRQCMFNKNILRRRLCPGEARPGVCSNPTQSRNTNRRAVTIQPRDDHNRVSDNLAALRYQFMPWSAGEGYYQRNGDDYPPSSSTHRANYNRANYNSTQVNPLNKQSLGS
jgi:hypothetical protein